MKKITIVLLFFCCAQLTRAQDCKGLSIGTKTVYPGPALPYSAPPKGYSAVFINHVGRHGARHLTKDMGESDTYILLKKADSLKALTPEGQKLWQMVLQLNAIEHKGFKNISSLGKQEQQGIGKRMATNNPTIFKNAKTVLNVTVTKEVRTVQSADAFLAGLKEKITDPEISRQTNDTTLRFYDMSPVYQQFKKGGTWTATLTQLETAEKYSQMTQGAARRFFTAPFLKTMKKEDQESFPAEIVGYANILYSLPEELKEAGTSRKELGFASFFSCDELQKFSAVDNAEEFLVKGPGTDPAGIQVKIAVPLLIDFIKTTDTYISSKTFNADLRFTHAEAIAPFAVLMGITGASKPENSGMAIAKVWNASKVIPLSANIQWVLYKSNNSGNYLVKFLLNEKEVAIDGIKPQNYPYYSWSEVRKLYIAKLMRLQASLETNGLLYLKEAR